MWCYRRNSEGGDGNIDLSKLSIRMYRASEEDVVEQRSHLIPCQTPPSCRFVTVRRSRCPPPPPKFLLALVEALRLIMGTNKCCFFRHIFVLNLKGMMRTFLHFCVSYQKWFHLHQKSKFVDFINKNSNFGRNFCCILYCVFTVSY